MTKLTIQAISYISLILSPIIAVSGLSVSFLFPMIAATIILLNYQSINIKTIFNNQIIWLFPAIIIVFCYLSPEDVLPFQLATKTLITYFLAIILTLLLKNKKTAITSKTLAHNSFNYHTIFLYLSYGYLIAIFTLLFIQTIDPDILSILGKKIYNINFNTEEYLILKINRQLCIFALLYLLVTIFFYNNKQKFLAFITYIITALTIFISHSETAKLVFIITNIIFIFTYYLNYKFRYLLVISYFLINLIAITIIPNLNIQKIAENTNLQHSAIHRLCIWQYTINLIKQNPFGYGFNSSSDLLHTSIKDKQTCVSPNKQTTTVMETIKYHISLHPHYNILQILLELGLAGLFFLGLLFLKTEYFLKETCSKKLSIAVSYSVLLGYLTIGSTGYDIWQSWYFSYLFLIAFYNFILIKKII